MKKKSVVETPHHPNKRSGPEPHKKHKCDGKCDGCESFMSSAEVVFKSMPDIPGLVLGGKVVTPRKPARREDPLELL